MTFLVRPATNADWPLIWPIIREVAASEETFAMEAAPNERVVRASWMTKHPGRVVLAIDEEGQVLGTANMYANRPNQGSHVASGSFMVAASARGRGVGRALVRDMIVWATDHGFRGIQFNAVVASNEGAVRLYETEGFRVIGTAPGAFLHPVLGPVDLLILWRDCLDVSLTPATSRLPSAGGQAFRASRSAADGEAHRPMSGPNS